MTDSVLVLPSSSTAETSIVCSPAGRSTDEVSYGSSISSPFRVTADEAIPAPASVMSVSTVIGPRAGSPACTPDTEISGPVLSTCTVRDTDSPPSPREALTVCSPSVAAVVSHWCAEPVKASSGRSNAAS
ncbi:hypothetical protein ACFFX0_26595 [Citricoccus parietis]|uniref:Uncharacterized protein n=1 Tax=Citricoccus parietis TaxID=592307 RepID=A0ABV5G6K9_9MICC